jgi:hypothetical protein
MVELYYVGIETMDAKQEILSQSLKGMSCRPDAQWEGEGGGALFVQVFCRERIYRDLTLSITIAFFLSPIFLVFYSM